MEKVAGIYCIKNKIDNKVYIGLSSNIYVRWQTHKNKLNSLSHINKHLQGAWIKYGEGAFEFSILELCDDINLLPDMEIKWIAQYNSSDKKFGYNMTSGGMGTKDLPEESRVAGRNKYKHLEEWDINKLKDGKRKITEDELRKICDMLINTDLPFYQIADNFGLYINEVYQIYKHNYYKFYTKDMVFKSRKHCVNNKLEEDDVLEIITMLKNREYATDIANLYGVSRATIGDILCGRTWTSLTNGINFPDHKKHMRPHPKPVEQYDLDGNYLKCYDSARKASEETGIGWKAISAICNGKQKQKDGFVFKFKKIN